MTPPAATPPQRFTDEQAMPENLFTTGSSHHALEWPSEALLGLL